MASASPASPNRRTAASQPALLDETAISPRTIPSEPTTTGSSIPEREEEAKSQLGSNRKSTTDKPPSIIRNPNSDTNTATIARPKRRESVHFAPTPIVSPSSSQTAMSSSYQQLSSPSSSSPQPRSSAEVSGTGENSEANTDERTAIVRSEAGGDRGYNTTSPPTGGVEESRNGKGVRQRNGGGKRRKRIRGRESGSERGGERARIDEDGDDSEREEQESWWRRLLARYGSVELDNKGSTARDHLALERTFLAWLRTSLSFASIGIAVTQLFRLNTTQPASPSPSANPSTSTSLSSDPQHQHQYQNPILTPQTTTCTTNAPLHQLGKPLGATFLGVAVLVLLVGYHRYFESQAWIIRGKFPASRGSVVLVSFVAGALCVASFVVVVVLGGGTRLES